LSQRPDGPAAGRDRPRRFSAAVPIRTARLVGPPVHAAGDDHLSDDHGRDELTAMNVGPSLRIATLIWDARFSLVTALLAGFGRAAAEVGAIIIVGGN